MNDNWFIKNRTRKVITWQGKLLLFFLTLFLPLVSWPLIRVWITNYIHQVDQLQPAPRILIENWTGQIESFEETYKVAKLAKANEIVSIVFEDYFYDSRKRQAFVHNAWAAGIDTNHFSLIPVQKLDPKTINIARAVVDTAYLRKWNELTIVTSNLHTARSRKAYQLMATRYGIKITVVGIPWEDITPENWWHNSIGLAGAFSELLKRIYYDLAVF